MNEEPSNPPADGSSVISRGSTMTFNKDVVCRDVGGESVLLDLDSGRYFGLDEVGSRIWTLLADGRTVAQVERLLLAEYDVDGAQLHRDIVQLLRELVKNGLVAIDHV